MENSINQRIRQIISYYKISDKDFAESIGVPQTTLSNIFIRNNYPKSDVLVSILGTYNEISSEWLMRGEGEMIKRNGVLAEHRVKLLLKSWLCNLLIFNM